MIQITQTMLEQANQYIPLATKAALAQAIAQACMEKVKVGVEKKTPTPYRRAGRKTRWPSTGH